MLQAFESLFNVILILLGFGLVIVVHELGHFLAARWAGIKVHAFAVGFGPAILSYRKGMGLRRGSSEPDYLKRLEAERIDTNRKQPSELSPTEYRLNWVPLGGYVKMLGQEDLNADATSDADDSYQSKPVWKRMIVISAGVIMNVILAAVLFVIVFMAGMRVMSPAVGFVAPDSPAAQAGFQPGDVVLSINDRPADNFADIQIASAMAAKGRELTFTVARPGASEPIELRATPQRDEESGLLQLGIGPASGTRVWGGDPQSPDEDAIRRTLRQTGLEALEPGSELVAVNGQPVEPAILPSGTRVPVLTPLTDALRDSNGQPVNTEFTTPAGQRITVPITPRVELQRALGVIRGDETASFAHLLGMVPVTRVQTTTVQGDRAGLQPGDLLARVGGVDWPSVPDTVAQIRQRAGSPIELIVIRPESSQTAPGESSPLNPVTPAGDDQLQLAGRRWTVVQLNPTVGPDGRIGFGPEEAADLPIITRAPRLARDPAIGDIPPDLPVDRLFPRIMPGMVLEAVNDTAVRNFGDARQAIVDAASQLITTSGEGGREGEADTQASPSPVDITLRLATLDPISLQRLGSEQRTIELFADDARAIAALGWLPGNIELAFTASQVTMKASDPFNAIAMGTRETLRKVTLAYQTIQRLFEGTVQVRHLKGPVGITHIGSQFAAQGPLYLLFFLALISANLAVINFLPMPIVDGGMFLLLCYEGLRGKPAPIVFQNALNLIGLVLIGTLFLTVTFYDIRGLFGL